MYGMDEWADLIATPPTPCRIGKRPLAPEARPAIEEKRPFALDCHYTAGALPVRARHEI